MYIVIDHLNVLLSQCSQCLIQTGNTVGNAGIVLNVSITVEVIRGLIQIVALHYIVQEALNQFAVFLRLVQIGDCYSTVGLGVTGRIGSSQCSQIIPVLSNLAAVIETENVEGHLLTGTGKVIYGLKEHLVTISKGADGVYRGLDRRRGQISNGADKGIKASAIGEIVLNIALCQQAGCLFGITGGEGVDEFDRFLNVCHFRFLLPICMAVAKSCSWMISPLELTLSLGSAVLLSSCL